MGLIIIMIISLAHPLKLCACPEKITYIDFFKAKKNIKTQGHSFIIRHITSLKFKTTKEIEIIEESPGISKPPGD